MIYSKCPNCECETLRVSTQLVYDEHSDTIQRVVMCNECEAHWTEIFKVMEKINLVIPSSDYEMIDYELVNQGKESVQ